MKNPSMNGSQTFRVTLPDGTIFYITKPLDAPREIKIVWEKETIVKKCRREEANSANLKSLGMTLPPGEKIFIGETENLDETNSRIVITSSSDRNTRMMFQAPFKVKFERSNAKQKGAKSA